MRYKKISAINLPVTTPEAKEPAFPEEYESRGISAGIKT
jgi:hypothetical protein